MAENVFYQYIGEHPAGRYSRAYSPGSAAAFICIGGKGYSYTWPQELGPTPWQDGQADGVLRQEYGEVSMISAAPNGRRLVSPTFLNRQRTASVTRLVRPQ